MPKAILRFTTDSDTGYLLKPDVSVDPRSPGAAPDRSLLQAQGKALVDWLAPTLEPHQGTRMTPADMASLRDEVTRRLAEESWPGRGQVQIEVQISPGI